MPIHCTHCRTSLRDETYCSTAALSIGWIMQREFQRVAIVNRGEAAIRFIHAAREFNREHGTSISTIALYTEPDRHAMFVREADEAVYLGPARIVDPHTNQSKRPHVHTALLKYRFRKG